MGWAGSRIVRLVCLIHLNNSSTRNQTKIEYSAVCEEFLRPTMVHSHRTGLHRLSSSRCPESSMDVVHGTSAASQQMYTNECCRAATLHGPHGATQVHPLRHAAHIIERSVGLPFQ